MAYVNVKDWSVEQVTEWLKGLDSVILQYTKSFLNNEVKGHQLLSLRSDDLEHLGVVTLGHQETILEAVEHLRNFHYKLDKENLQLLALKLSCTANSLFKELSLTDENCTMVPTQTMSDVHNIITSIKPLVCWLDRSPFRGDKYYVDCKAQLLELSFEMATSAHRDIFSEKPLRSIRNISSTLAQLADHIIQELSDPMVLQPASLALATLKKKEQELGFFLLPSNYAIHQIAEIKYGSPAHNSSKIEEGDEIVQVNYQTVVGWQRKNVLLLLQESPPEIVLTLKKRPRHTKVYGQIYMKPYRLPSKKRATPYSRWNDNLPSPQLLAIHDLPQIPPPRLPPVVTQPEIEAEISSSSDSEPLDSPLDGGGRVYPLKPRPVLQRRNTITGASPTSKRPNQAIEQYWQLLKNQAVSRHSSSYNIPGGKYEEESTLLRDKSASCNNGFELAPRPTTIIGLSHTKTNKSNANTDFRKRFHEQPSKKKKVNFDETATLITKPSKSDSINSPNTSLSEERSVSINSLSSLSESIDFIDEGEDLTDRSNMKTEWQKEIVEELIDTINFEQKNPKRGSDSSFSNIEKDDTFADVHVHNIIKKFDEKKSDGASRNVKPKVFPKNVVEKPPELPQKPDFTKKPVVPPKNIKPKVRGILNKSHSTPAYDQSNEQLNEPKLPQEKTACEASYVKPLHLIKDVDETRQDINNYNAPIKYELGIPIVDSNPFYMPVHSEEKMHYVDADDIPPKPPPRLSLSESSKYKSEYSHKPSDDLCSPQLVRSPDYAASLDNLHTEADSLHSHFTESTENVFEPKSVSTPVTKQCRIEFPEVDFTYSKSPSSLETTMRITQDNNKISPTNSIVRAMMYSNKNKGGKKKNTLIAKRRNVGVKDVVPGDLQGFLYQRSRSKQSQPAHWEKRWFVLTGSNLYGFESKDSLKAQCLIFLAGFTVSVAAEVKSRSNAFKVYHTGTVFYFSTEDSDMLTTWIELIAAATLLDHSKATEPLQYSETDDSDTEKTKSTKLEPVRKFGSLKKVRTGKTSAAPSGSSSLDRTWFFNKANSIYKNSLPVPTAQFRSYRKIPSSSINVTGSKSTGNFTSHIPDFSPGFDPDIHSASTTNLTLTEPPKKNTETAITKPKPLNYVHASNPNLCDISDLHLRNFHKLQPFQNQCSDNLAGFVTLEELMNRQTEEQKLNPHIYKESIIDVNSIRGDVVYNELPAMRKETIKTHSRTSSDCSEIKKPLQNDLSTKQTSESTSFCFGKRGSLKKQKKERPDNSEACSKIDASGDILNRSLPRMHKLKDSPSLPRKSKRQQPISFTSKEYSVSYVDLKDHSNEMVFCPQRHNDVQFAQNRTLDGKRKSGKIVRQHSLTSVDKKELKGSTEKLWTDSLLRRRDKVGDKSSVNVTLKSAIQYTPMLLPLAPDQKGKLNPKLAFELNLDEKVSKTGKFKSFFVKQSDGKKEKTLLGSPKLHRAVFGSEASSLAWTTDSSQASCHIDECYNVEEWSSRADMIAPLHHNTPTIDYPGLEYPPIFEPETYSLSDPQCSISLLRKQDKN